MSGIIQATNLQTDNIKSSGGTTAQTIDSTGRIFTPARPSILLDFENGSSAGYEEIANLAVLPYRNKVQGVGITNDSSAFSITIPVSGLYQLSMAVLTDAEEGIELAVTVNGTASSNIILRNYTANTRSNTMNVAYEFSANDVLKIINNTGASRGFYRGYFPSDTGRYSYWSMYLIG